MHIEELQLKNFRGFKELTLKFPPKKSSSNVAVLIGVNGSGKSSILDCISILLTHLSLRIIQKIEMPKKSYQKVDYNDYLELDYPRLNLEDVNISSNKSKVSLKLKLDEENTIDTYIKLDLLPELYSIQKEYFYPDTPEDYYDFINKKLFVNADASIPILLHYRTNRFAIVGKDISIFQSSLLSRFLQFDAYQKCTTTKQNDFATFFQWFRTVEDIENEQRLEGNNDYRDKQLQLVRKAIPSILGDDYTNLRIKRINSKMMVKKGGETFSFNQLSDGERGLIAMVGDIARRLAIANPSLDDPLKGEGIILIDEIELHLHPQWQRKIIPALTSTFPNCQFIVTTHSPQVLSEVEKENVFILEDFKLVKYQPYTYGRDSNSILSELMRYSERSPKIQDQIDSCFQLIDDDKLDEARGELKKLSELLGQNDPEVVRANTLIDFFHRIE